ncbi:tripartite motif-containing protein 29-like isoform X1 [Polypterus senegalus]|uniref:tripartite motif-containing protein 29-like isoform X1 n=1 Tax=Polypterus senegalus TaxID=55291 RepID=UPI0019647BD6|nr:tripartite motif-containing protein 29-like isoform X1 [Polypterus senegalus]
MEIYCRTDQTCICYLCAATEHKSHDTVTPDVERTERQAQLLTSFNDSKEKIQSKEKTLTKVTVTISQLKSSADKEIQEYEKTFTSLLRSIESLRSQVTEVVRDHEQREVKRAEELKKRLEKEIEELKRRNTELVELSQTDDDIHFLQKFPSVQACSESEDTANTAINVHFFLEDLRENLSNLQKCLKEVSCWKFVNISKSETSAPEVKRMRKVEEEAHSSGVPTWDWFSKKSSPVVGKDKVTIEVVGLEKTFHSGRRFFEDLIKKMNDSRIDIHQGVFDSQSSNLALLFCPIVSRIGTDIKVALKKIPNNKKVILVVMHHTLNPGHIVAESARFVEQKNVVGTVDLLFHENLGLLECQLNKQSLEKVFFFCKDHCMK